MLNNVPWFSSQGCETCASHCETDRVTIAVILKFLQAYCMGNFALCLIIFSFGQKCALAMNACKVVMRKDDTLVCPCFTQ